LINIPAPHTAVEQLVLAEHRRAARARRTAAAVLKTLYRANLVKRRP